MVSGSLLDIPAKVHPIHQSHIPLFFFWWHWPSGIMGMSSGQDPNSGRYREHCPPPPKNIVEEIGSIAPPIFLLLQFVPQNPSQNFLLPTPNFNTGAATAFTSLLLFFRPIFSVWFSSLDPNLVQKSFILAPMIEICKKIYEFLAHQSSICSQFKFISLQNILKTCSSIGPTVFFFLGGGEEDIKFCSPLTKQLNCMVNWSIDPLSNQWQHQGREWLCKMHFWGQKSPKLAKNCRYLHFFLMTAGKLGGGEGVELLVEECPLMPPKTNIFLLLDLTMQFCIKSSFIIFTIMPTS